MYIGKTFLLSAKPSENHGRQLISTSSAVSNFMAPESKSEGTIDLMKEERHALTERLKQEL